MVRFTAAVVVTAVVAVPAWAAEPTNPREVVEAYLAAALGGKTDAAVALAMPGKSPARAKNIEEFRAEVGVEKLAVPLVIVSEKLKVALAVTDPIKVAKPDRDGRDIGVLLIELNETADGWRIRDIDFELPEVAERDLKKARTAADDWTEIPPAKK